MIVYHGSVIKIDKPDVRHSLRALDFGKGFYVTTNLHQAEQWARRKALILGRGQPMINVYQLSENSDGLCWKTFDDHLDEWIDFVCACRNGEEIYKVYDLITGKVANDRVFRVVDMYRSGEWDRERALREIRAYPDYDQTALITQRAIDQLLVFEEYREV